MLQQLVPESCFLTSSRVSWVNPLVALGDDDADLDGEALADVEGVTFKTVPLFQISFLPDLTQKYLTPPVVLVKPTLAQVVPAIVAACEGRAKVDRNTAVTRTLEYALDFMC